MKTSLSAVALSAALFSAPAAYAACSNIPADLTEPNYGVTQWLGGGYDQDRERVKVMTCLNGQKVRETGNSSAQINVGLLTDYQQVERELKRKMGGNIARVFHVYNAPCKPTKDS